MKNQVLINKKSEKMLFCFIETEFIVLKLYLIFFPIIKTSSIDYSLNLADLKINQKKKRNKYQFIYNQLYSLNI